MHLERWLYKVPLRLRSLFRGRQVEQELDEELQDHLECRIAQGIAGGLSREQARYAALRAMGGLDQRKEECRDARGLRLFTDLLQDLRYALRQLRRSPGFAAMAIITLALGIGATTAVFSLVSATLLPALPYRDASRLVTMSVIDPLRPGGGSMKFEEFEYSPWKQSARSCDRVGAFLENDYTLAGGGAAEFPVPVHVALVSEEFFPMLGVPATIGRTIESSDFPTGYVQMPGVPASMGRRRQFGPNGIPPIVISNRLFQSRFGSNRDILGQIVQIPDFPETGRRFKVIGVMPNEFQFPQDTDVWFPWCIFSARIDSGFLIARLAPGMSKDQAKAELDVVLRSAKPAGVPNVLLPPEFQPMPVPLRQSKVVSLREYLGGNVRTSLLVLLGAVGLVMLIACINVTNLLLLRNQKRGHEMRVRAALGASSSRLARQTLTESALLAVAGGAGGILLAWSMMRGLPRLAPLGLLPRSAVAMDSRVLLFAVLVTMLTSIFVGLLPALRQPGTALGESIKQAGGYAATHDRRLLHGVLVAAQVALTLILLCAAGLMIRSFILLRSVTPNFQSANILKFEVSVNAFKGENSRSSAAFAKAYAYCRQFYGRLIEQLQSFPEVKRACISNTLPGSRTSTSGSVRGQPGVVTRVSPGYFEMLGIPLIAGRSFTAADNQPDAPKVAIINRTAARSWFGTEDAVGRSPGDGTPVVIGVVADVKQLSVSQTIYPEVYVPILQRDVPFNLSVMVETRQEPGGFVSTIRRLVAGIDPEVPVHRPMTMQEYISSTLARDRFSTLLLAWFAASTLVLAAVGIYSVVAQSVEQRLREIAVRMALGARPDQVMRQVFVRGAVQIGAGLVVGLLGAIATVRTLRSLLFQVTPYDPATFGGVLLLLVTVAFLACYGPARRATKVDPLTILRAE